MKIFLIIITLCTVGLTSTAQKRLYAKLHLVYPQQLGYDTLLIHDSKGNLLTPIATSLKNGKTMDTYILGIDSLFQGGFSIYFGGSSSAVNDFLYFQSEGKDLLIQLKDSFALRDRVHFKLKNVYNFEELYERYNQYYRSQMQDYDSLIKNNPRFQFSKDQYALKSGFDFVKTNVDNPYSIDLFSVFVINPPFFHVDYSQANQFYIKNLKNKIRDPKERMFVEDKMEKLKQTLKEGSKAPFFSAISIQGKLLNSNLLAGKNVLMIFWATWCGPCLKELRYLKQINEEYKGNNLVMVSVSLDRDSIKMTEVINRNKLNWIHIFNSKPTVDAFRINPIPALFLIDEKGVILYNGLSREKETDSLQILMSLLKQKFKH